MPPKKATAKKGSDPGGGTAGRMSNSNEEGGGGGGGGPRHRTPAQFSGPIGIGFSGFGPNGTGQGAGFGQGTPFGQGAPFGQSTPFGRPMAAAAEARGDPFSAASMGRSASLGNPSQSAATEFGRASGFFIDPSNFAHAPSGKGKGKGPSFNRQQYVGSLSAISGPREFPRNRTGVSVRTARAHLNENMPMFTATQTGTRKNRQPAKAGPARAEAAKASGPPARAPPPYRPWATTPAERGAAYDPANAFAAQPPRVIGSAWYHKDGHLVSWSNKTMDKHLRSLGTLDSLLKTDDCILVSLRGEVLRDTRGVLNGVAFDSIEASDTLTVIKSMLKESSIKEGREFHTDIGQQHDVWANCISQASVARRSYDVATRELAAGGTDRRQMLKLQQDIKFFRGIYEENMELIESLTETEMGSVEFTRVDRLFQELALDIDNACMTVRDLEGDGTIDWVQRRKAVKRLHQLDINDFNKRIKSLAFLIKELGDLHYTKAGAEYIKETMFNYLAILKLYTVKLHWGGEEQYSFLEYIQTDSRYSGLIEELCSANKSFRRLIYEKRILLAGGWAIPIELVKLSARVLQGTFKGSYHAVQYLKHNYRGLSRVLENRREILNTALRPIAHAFRYLQGRLLEPETLANMDPELGPDEEISVHELGGYMAKIRGKLQRDDVSGRQLAAFEHAARTVEATVRDYERVNDEIRDSQTELDEGNFEIEPDDAPPAYADKLYKGLEKQAKALRANKQAMIAQKEWLISQIPPKDPSLLPPVLSDPTLRRLEGNDGEYGMRDTPIEDREVAEFLVSLGGGLRDRLRAEALTPPNGSNNESGSGSGSNSGSGSGRRSRKGSMSESGRSRSGSRRRRGSKSGSGSGSGSNNEHNWEGPSRYRQESQGNY